MKTKMMTSVAVAAIALAMTGAAQAADLTVLRSFKSNTASDGMYPHGDVTVDGTTIYGMTNNGGASGLPAGSAGVAFKMNTNGSGYQILRSFNSSTDGSFPLHSLTRSGSTLYGMTSQYGPNGYQNAGTIFKMNTDGSNFSVLHGFSDNNDSAPGAPKGSLTLVDSTLYGMTNRGGAYNSGTIFKINTDGTGYQTMHAFAGGVGGTSPEGSLTLAGNKLYGTTAGDGGYSSKGSVFRMDLDGTNFETLRIFAGGANDGHTPLDSLTISGSTIYGTTKYGGGSSGSDKGTIFKMDTDGTDFSLLHKFTDTAGSGRYPTGSLTLVGSKLVGMTSEAWGSNGTIFMINADGSGFEKLHDFAGTGSGGTPRGSLTLSDSTLYGMTWNGGTDGYGTVFSFDASAIPEPSTITVILLGIALLLGRRRKPSL